MKKKLILTLFTTLIGLSSTAVLQQQNFVASACEFKSTEQEKKQAIENCRKDILETLDEMHCFLEQNLKKQSESDLYLIIHQKQIHL